MDLSMAATGATAAAGGVFVDIVGRSGRVEGIKRKYRFRMNVIKK